MLTSIAFALLGCFALGGCKRTSQSRLPEGGDLDSYLAALDDNERDLRAAGIHVPPAHDDPQAFALRTDGKHERIDEPAPPAEETSTEEDELAASDDMATPEYEPDDDAAASSAPPTAAKEKHRRSDNRCTRICDLAEMACELETRICDLAQGHADEPRYTQACARAHNQCSSAIEACDAC